MKFQLRITGDLGFEFWQDIPGYEGLYQASTYGKIRSLKRNTTDGKILKAQIRPDGYMTVSLCKNGCEKVYRINRILALTFFRKPKDSEYQVNHKDENPKNDRVENLEWCTSKYNINYGSHNKKMAKAKSKPVKQYDLSGNFLAEYPSIIEVERQKGYDNGHIAACCKNKYGFKTAYGYKWKYAEE